ncbi:PREDICTED: uncharacterized protein LOC104605898 [Nelumbo nucifera]|uniref:Uncharacterized protein LOC104605898 n=1 Tax=Nelumbo nucifera TaxID=4432 RepID=A0A1U8AMU6_NELNU|nr:PREDICTED: uncharacterized protein LOC104605898 [Nelumbo nucifera]
MASRVVTIKQVFPSGTESEVLRVEKAVLSLVGYDNGGQTAGVIRTGEFSIGVVMQTISPILVTVCMVGDLQWPITKDSPSLRVGSRSFAFAMPGLLYGLQFPEDCSEQAMQVLERVLTRFSHYEDHSLSGRESGTKFLVPEAEPSFWSASQSKIRELTDPLLNQIGAGPAGKSPARMGGMDEGLLKAIRMSGVTKLISKAVLVGGLQPEHVDIFDMRPQSNANQNVNLLRAFATIFAFSDLVEAVEATRLVISGNRRSLPLFHPTWTPLPGIRTWNINKKGLLLLLQVLIASASIYNDEGLGAMDNTTDHEEKRRAKVVMDSELTEEESRVGEPMEHKAKSSDEAKEQETTSKEEEEEEEEETVAVREISFPIIAVAGNGITGRGGKKQVNDKLEKACVGMEVI